MKSAKFIAAGFALPQIRATFVLRNTSPMQTKKLLQALGPGLLYASAAIGVSHLVQSTRAGADFGFDLLIFLLIANVLKYPFFEFAPRYAGATGQSLLKGYEKIGSWAISVFTAITVLTMFAIVAAVTMVTAGLVGYAFKLAISPVYISAIILAVAASILIIGRYKLLDTVVKYIVVILTVSTIFAVFSAIEPAASEDVLRQNFDFARRSHILFLIAFFGWMPAPVDISVWHSLWSEAKNKTAKEKIGMKGGMLDFKIGYIGTALIAIFFLTLGALVMYGASEELAGKGVAFSEQLIKLYTSSIGEWTYPIIAVAGIATMLSTTLAVVDAYPRVLTPLTKYYFPKLSGRQNSLYWVWMAITILGSLILMGYLSNTMTFMVDLATTLSFITAPIVALLNHKAVTGKDFPQKYKPGKGMKLYSLTGILILSLFSLFYIVYVLIF